MLPDFEAAGLTSAIGSEHLYPSVKLAVAAFPRPDVDGTSLS